MYACPICGDLYLSREEADLCSPRADWARRYPHRVRELASAFGPIEKS